MGDDYQKLINMGGEALLRVINSLTQIAKMHLENNDLLVDTIRQFIHTVARAAADLRRKDVAVQIANGRFYYQEEKLIIRPANAKLFNQMLRFLENRRIYGLHFSSDLSRVAPKSIVNFARLLDRCIRKDHPSEWLALRIQAEGLDWVWIDQVEPSKLGDLSLVPDEATPAQVLELKKMQVRKSYAQVMGSVKEVARKLSCNEAAGMRNSVRLVQKMVDLITDDEALFLGMSTMRIYDDYTYVHSLNVAILSMCLGKRIGLSHRSLERLGLCGLFHDLGKVEIPKHILNKKGELDPAEFDQLKSHSMHSARLILKLKASRDRKIKLLVPPFEHHIGYDHSGYPEVGIGPRLSLFGRILTIADVYDAITSPRIYRPNALSPDQAINQMLDRSGSYFDPILLKVFADMMGAFPVGTLLKFRSGELGITLHPNPRADRARPVVQLLNADGKGNFTKGNLLDLAQKHPLSEDFPFNIVESMHPSALGIQAAEFLMST